MTKMILRGWAHRAGESELYTVICKERLTLEAVCVEKVLALLVALDAALGAADALARDAPQQPLALVAVGRLLRRPQHEVVRRRRRDRVNHSLQRLLVHVQFLSKWEREDNLIVARLMYILGGSTRNGQTYP